MTPAERASMDAPRILNRYRLIERLASGGSAEVWRAHDERLNRPVAVKRLHAHLLPDVASRRRLAAEARAAAALSHPAVVGVYDVDIEGESPVLVMELVEGESLADRLAREGPLEPAVAARIGAELGDALFHAHQQGVIHRDVKPGNVLLGRDGRVRLVDFGIAHSLAASAERLTMTGTVVGTLRSMAPEQLAAGAITPRTDLYGLGAVLHESLTGRSPYPSSTPLMLAEAQRRGPPQLEGVDPALAAVTAACLAYDPSDRPLHAGAVAGALRDWIDGDARAAAAMAPAAAPVASADDETVASHAVVPPFRVSPARPAPARGRGVLLPLLLAGAIGIAALWLVLAGPGGPTDQGTAEPTATPSPTPVATPIATAVPSPVPTPTPIPLPEWALELTADVVEECGTSVQPGLADELAAMGKDAAKDHADALIEACEEAREEGGGNRGRG